MMAMHASDQISSTEWNSMKLRDQKLIEISLKQRYSYVWLDEWCSHCSDVRHSDLQRHPIFPVMFTAYA